MKKTLEAESLSTLELYTVVYNWFYFLKASQRLIIQYHLQIKPLWNFCMIIVVKTLLEGSEKRYSG